VTIIPLFDFTNRFNKIEEENRIASNQYENLKQIFSNIDPNNTFGDIHDPVKWQKEIRDEWETR
jgi:Xaa-Pro aminopeptidase